MRRAVRLLDAAAVPHGIDRYLELVAPTWSSRDIRAKVVHASRRTPSTATLTLRPNLNWAGFRAGQHTVVTVEIDGVRHSRCYSIASSAHGDDGLLELTVKAHRGGTVSRYLVDHAAVGLVVGLSPAQGEFVLPAPRPPKLVLISGGSGITPVMSMLRTLIDEGHEGAVTFLHYERTPADNPYRAEMAAAPANVRLLEVHTSEDGHFNPAHLPLLDADTEVFVCGPAGLRAAVRAHLTATGWVDRYHDEAFVPAEGQPTDGTVMFAASGRSVADDGRSLLLQARSAGLSPTSGCGMGLCHTCTAHLTSGAVRNLTNGDVTRVGDDSRPVPIQICIHAPAGDAGVDL